MTQAPDYPEIREAVARLCADFPGEYWRALDREGRYPDEFVQALTENGYLAVLIGATLLGILGALLAIPIAGIVQVLVQEWWAARRGVTPPPAPGTTLTGPRAEPPPTPEAT